jgi:hypothetical protein
MRALKQTPLLRINPLMLRTLCTSSATAMMTRVRYVNLPMTLFTNIASMPIALRSATHNGINRSALMQRQFTGTQLGFVLS